MAVECCTKMNLHSVKHFLLSIKKKKTARSSMHYINHKYTECLAAIHNIC